MCMSKTYFPVRASWCRFSCSEVILHSDLKILVVIYSKEREAFTSKQFVCWLRLFLERKLRLLRRLLLEAMLPMAHDLLSNHDTCRNNVPTFSYPQLHATLDDQTSWRFEVSVKHSLNDKRTLTTSFSALYKHECISFLDPRNDCNTRQMRFHGHKRPILTANQ